MSRKLGISGTMLQDNDLPKTNATFSNTDLVIPIAATQKVRAIAYLPVTLAGAVSGAKWFVDAPAAPAVYLVMFKIFNSSTATIATLGTLLAEAAFSNALANTGTHWAECVIYVENGATAGNIIVQFAQLTADASAATFLKGANMTYQYL